MPIRLVLKCVDVATVVDGRAGALVSGNMTFDQSGPETAAAANGPTVKASGMADLGN